MMSSYIPCMECKNRYGREYSKLCDGFCEYAKAVHEKNKLEAFKQFWDNMYGNEIVIIDGDKVGGAELYDTFYDSAMHLYDEVSEINDDKLED